MTTIETLRDDWLKRRRVALIHPRLAVSDDGVTLGADTIVARFADEQRSTTPTLAITGREERILAVLSAAYRTDASPAIIVGLRAADRALAKRDRSLAAICLAQIGLPPLEDEDAAYRLHMAAGLIDTGVPPRALLKAWGIATSGLDRIDLDRLAKFNYCHDKDTGRFTTGPCGTSDGKRFYVVDGLDEFWRNKKDRVQGNGQCVALARAGDPNLPPATTWKAGDSLADLPNIPRGTVIATFKDGKYPNASHGNHTAIFDDYALDDEGRIVGINVYEQYSGQAPQPKFYRFKKPNARKPNSITGIDISDANSYSVVTTVK